MGHHCRSALGDAAPSDHADAPAPPGPESLPGPVDGTPPRRPGSLRRTATIDMGWPGGLGTALHLVGRARDLLTPLRGDPVVLDAAEMHAEIGEHRTITAIRTTPPRPGIDGLVGARGGVFLRGAIDRVLPGEREAATALHLLLDDIAGTSLIAGFVWSRWLPEEFRRRRAERGPLGIRKGRVICSGLRPGGFAQTAVAEGRDLAHAVRPATPLSCADDPWAWHELPDRPEVCMRRHRRIDLHPEDGTVAVDGFFRDSCWEPDGSEIVLHEYTVTARLAVASATLLEVAATPRVLPFPECPAAAPNVVRLVGMRASTFRTGVQETLTELECCTHLNDVLRGLAEVPVLARALDPLVTGSAGADAPGAPRPVHGRQPAGKPASGDRR